MLEQRDVNLLKNMMESVVSASEERILNKVDERLTDSEERILNKVDERLADSEERILNKVDERLADSEERILNKVDEKLSDSENLILEEMERTRQILDKRIDKVQENINELKQYYNITKLEHDNTAMLLKMIDNLSKRIEEVERRTA